MLTATYFETNTKHTNTHCGPNTEIFLKLKLVIHKHCVVK